MKKYLIVVFLLVSIISNGQEMYRISHYSALNTLYSPSMSSAYSGVNISVLGRSQWNNTPGSPKSFVANLTSQILGSKFYINGNVVVDQLSVFNNIEGNLGLTYKLSLNENNYLSLGVQGGFRSFKVDYSRAIYSLGDDYLYQNLNSNVRGLVTPSLTYLNKPLMISASIGGQDLLGMKNLFGYVNKQTVLKKDVLDLHVSLLYKQSLGTKRNQLDINSLVMYRNLFGLGVGYRLNNELVLMARMNIKSLFQVGYCFDLGMSKIKGYTGHEIYLKYTIQKSKNSKSSGYTNPLI